VLTFPLLQQQAHMSEQLTLSEAQAACRGCGCNRSIKFTVIVHPQGPGPIVSRLQICFQLEVLIYSTILQTLNVNVNHTGAIGATISPISMPPASHANVGQDADTGCNIHEANLGSDSVAESDTVPETKGIHGVPVSYLTNLVIFHNLQSSCTAGQ
jgi:hypothetical protein